MLPFLCLIKGGTLDHYSTVCNLDFSGGYSQLFMHRPIHCRSIDYCVYLTDIHVQHVRKRKENTMSLLMLLWGGNFIVNNTFVCNPILVDLFVLQNNTSFIAVLLCVVHTLLWFNMIEYRFRNQIFFAQTRQ